MTIRISDFTKTLLAVLLINQLLSFPAWAESPDLSTIKNRPIRKYIKAAVQHLKDSSLANRDHLPASFTYSKISDPVIVNHSSKEDGSHYTHLHSKLVTLADMGRSILWREDRLNMIRIYTKVYNAVPKKFRASLVLPSQLKKLSTKEIINVHTKFASFLKLNFKKILIELDGDLLLLLTSNPMGNCYDETGYVYSGSYGESTHRCELNEYQSDGLYMQNQFPLRNKVTCIKDQGRRGTCTAHGIAASIETLKLVAGGSPENLSEQDIYYKSEVYGDSQINTVQMQLYGNSIDRSLDTFDRRNFGIYYENAWSYNQSLSMLAPRIEVSSGLYDMPSSCSSNYNGASCADNAWQTQELSSRFAIPEPADEPTGSAAIQHHITSNSWLVGYGAGSPGADYSLQQAILLLNASVPVILSLDVTDDFVHASSPYIRYSSADPVAGGHTMEMIGFIRNRNLPAGVTPATMEGYFVVKNSWGINAGDCGFYYIDYNYVRHHFYYLNVITVN